MLHTNKIVFLFLIILNSVLIADSEPNNSCAQVEIVSSLNGATPTISRTINGTVHQTSDRFDYYSFTVSASGILDFNYTADKTNASFFIGSSCGGSQYYSNTDNSDTKNPAPFFVSAGDTIYLLIERRYDSSMNYSISVNYASPTFSGSNFKDFSILYSENLRGDIRMIGNTIMGQRNSQGNTVCPSNNTNNADGDIRTQHWDIDGVSSTFNSSSATLSIPEGAIIQKAYLYWQGRVLSNQYNNAKSIKFRQPGAPNYTTLTASDNNMHWTSYGSYYPYQASVEVTSLINGSGTYTVADLNTYAGNYIDGLGAYGAWSLVVVYKKDDALLQNITIYDGYQTIASNSSQNFTLSGFLTPSNGDVNSKFLVFTGEGDVDLLRDYVNISGTRLTRFNDNSIDSTQFNTFNASITENNSYVTSRSPNCQNNLGIDIHTYNVGTSGLGIIGNNQTNATLQIGTNQDAYYLSVFAFATELYEPRVCYYIDTIKQIDTNTTIFENKKFIGEIEADTEYTFDIWISNMKKSSSDTFIETARLVQVYMNMYDVDYSENSMSMQNLGEASKLSISDAIDNDKGEFASDQNKSTWRVGIGADQDQGGTLAPASSFNDDSKKAFISYKAKFQVDENTTTIDLVNFFKFKASFQTDSITIGSDNAQFIEQCLDLNTTASVTQPPKGAFNVVNANFSGGSLNSDSDTALFTQVSSQNFSVKVVALNNDFQTLQSYTGDVNLSLISSPSYTGDESSDQALCDSATSVGSPITIQFNNETIKPISLVTNDAMKSASFKISFESNGVVKHVCSTDSFAIRPANYSYSFTPSTLIGGKEHTLTSNAGTSLYDGTASQTISLIIPPGCGLGADTNTTSITFSGGIDSSLVRTGNIGDYNITVVDNTWTGIDQGTSHGDDCIVGSFENTPSGGLVGCNTQTSQTFTFSPKDFLNTLALQNFNANNFTYISNDNNMSATATATITARLDNNTTASAYSANCYAKDINTTISLIDEPLASEWLTNDRNATVRIRFFDTNTTNSELNATGSSTLSSGQNNFNNGIANITINFNFDRNTSIPDEPFHISRNDFNISVIDTNGVTGIDFNRTNDTNTTFYYGRVYAPDQTFNDNNENAQFHYEVYCQDCNRTSLNIAGNESINNINWYQNTLHVNTTFGTYNNLNPSALNGTLIGGTTLNTLGLTAPNLPHVDRITYTPHPWLIFNPSNPNATTDDFMVEFTSRGGWGGEGSVDGSDDNNTGLFIHRQDTINNQIQKRMDW
jgi:hypothetical protein